MLVHPYLMYKVYNEHFSSVDIGELFWFMSGFGILVGEVFIIFFLDNLKNIS